MTGEVVAAVAVGLAAVALVLGPLLRGGAGALVRRPESYAELADQEETPRGIAIAALKEIEFDRETGKLSDEDYGYLKRKYTAIALETLRAEDAAETAAATEAAAAAADAPLLGDDLEALIAARVRALRAPRPAAAAPLACLTCGPRPEPDPVFCSACGTRLGEPEHCGRCHAPLRADSRFCEQCGVQVAA